MTNNRWTRDCDADDIVACEEPWLAGNRPTDERRHDDAELLDRSPVVAVSGGWRPGERARTLVGLGPLEVAVLRAVWDRSGRVTVRDVYEDLRRRRRTAYTTVMTTVSNLERKGLLRADRRHCAYTYEPLVSDVEVAAAIVDVVVAEVLGGNAHALEGLLATGRVARSPGAGREELGGDQAGAAP